MLQPKLTSFVAGELSPKFEGRTDLEVYYRGCSQLVNFLLMRQGGVRRRPGTIFAASGYYGVSADTYSQMRRHRLIPFIVDQETAYVFEATIEPNASATANVWQVFYDHANVGYDFGVATSIASIHDLQFVQVKGVMYLAARDMPPQKITFVSTASWTCSAQTYLAGSVSLNTASNYPEAVTFQDGRLIYARDNTVWGSRVDSLSDFVLGASADAAFQYTIGGTKAVRILSMESMEELVLFTTHGPMVMIGSAEAGITPAVTPLTRFRASWGAEVVQPQKFQDAILFVQKGGMQIRELFWQQGWKSPEVTALSDHIGGEYMMLPDAVAASAPEWNHNTRGFIDLDIQQDPEPILWAVRADGKLAALVYDKTAGVAGWSVMETGGYPGAPTSSNNWFGDGHVGSVCVIPNTSGQDELWLYTVRWTPNGYRSMVEYMAPMDYDNDYDGHFVDAGIDLSIGDKELVATLTAAASSWTFAYQGGTTLGFVSGDTVVLKDISAGSTWADLNREVFTIASISTSIHTIASSPPSGAVTEVATSLISLGDVMKVAATASGLAHLAGCTVAVNLDGMAVASQLVAAGGTISLPEYANRIHAGLPYTSKMKTMNLSMGFMGKITQVLLRVYKSLGGQMGSDEDSLAPIRIKTVGGDTVYGTEPHFSGNVVQEWPSGYTREQYVYLQQTQPLPMYVLSMIPTVYVNQKG